MAQGTRKDNPNLWIGVLLVLLFLGVAGVFLLTTYRYDEAYAVCMRNGNGKEFCDYFAKAYTRILWK